MYYAGGGLAFSVLATVALASVVQPSTKSDHNEAPPGFDLHEHEGFVKTGSNAIPLFPRTIMLPSIASTRSPALPAGTGDVDDEYQLIGLGVRTVSFLSIKVYVVGLYVASSDVAALQARFVKHGAEVEGASALVAGERERLRQRLSDPEQGQELWNAILKDGGIRSAMRIVPTRSTDFAHLRDGWMRAIQSRSGVGVGGEKYDDEAFGSAVNAFKQLMGRGSLAKGKVMLLGRSADGSLSMWVQPGDTESGIEKIGELSDERVSRLIWLNYLGGKQVASEAARTSIIEGVMDMVARPIGTVETMVI